MKKIYSFIIAGVCFANVAIAQDETAELKSKKGTPILPVAKEFALGVDALPFLTGILSTNFDPSFQYSGVPNNRIGISGKMMIDEKTAYRARFNFGASNVIDKAVVDKSQLVVTPGFPSFVEDWRKTSNTYLLLAAGYEKRRGSGRLQAIYGGEAIFSLSSSKRKYEYGNSINQDFNAPSTNNFDGNVTNVAGSFARSTETKTGSESFFGVRGFVGVEYFFAPKISIGGEFGYMIGYQFQGKGLRTLETWDAAANTTRTVKIDEYSGPRTNAFSAGLENVNGAVNLLFYF